MNESPRIVSAAPSPSGAYVVVATFADGASVELDLGPFLRANAGHEAAAPYLDPDRFAEVRVVDGDLAWGEDWDILLPAETVRAGRVGGRAIGGGA